MNKLSINSPNKIAELHGPDQKRTRNEASKKAAESTGKSVERNDNVAVSGKASEVAQLASQVSKLPEVRSELIEKFSAKLESGDFRPSSKALASAILFEELT